jgi:hypothetical protein
LGATGRGAIGTGGTGLGAGVQAVPLTPADQAQINRLVQNLNILRSGGRVTIGNRQQLISGLRTAATGPVQPSDVLLTRLANNLFSTVPRLNLNGTQLTQLAVDLHRILNSASLSPAEAQLALADAQRLLTFNRTSMQQPLVTQQSQAILNDLAAITNELQREAAGAAPAAPAATPAVPQLPAGGQTNPDGESSPGQSPFR